MSPEIRRASQADLGSIQKIAERTIDGSYRSFLGDANVDSFLGSGASDHYLRDHIDSCWILLVDDRIVRFCVCKSDLIDLMMIDIDSHRSGLGTTLLRTCEQRLFKDYVQLFLESFEGNVAASAFYRKNGWEKAGEKLDSDTGTTKLTFTKRRRLA